MGQLPPAMRICFGWSGQSSATGALARRVRGALARAAGFEGPLFCETTIRAWAWPPEAAPCSTLRY
eukprot:scaffold3451_cov116-Isochrysis_galbana.AAC.10